MNSEKILARKLNTKVKTIKLAGHNINYVESGEGDAILLLHGASIGWGAWHLNIVELAKYFHVYALDLPGSGHSQPVDFRNLTIDEDYVKVVVQFIIRNNLKKVNLIGHSFGGVVAIKIALEYPDLVNKLILVNPLGFSSKIPNSQKAVGIYRIAHFLSRTAVKPNRKNMEKFVKDPLYDQSSVDPEFVDYFFEGVTKHKSSHPLLFMNSLTRRLKMKAEVVILDRLEDINKPVMVIIGEKDRMLPIKKILKKIRLIPGVKVELFRETGHVPPIEKSEKFNNTVLKFLA